MRVPWRARRSNLSILNEINPEYSLIGKTDAEAEVPILWPLNAKSASLEKTLRQGKFEGRRRRRTTEDEMVGWHH